jgi:probable phosphoglycerate mutase
VYTSDLKRAHQTATAVAVQQGLEAISHPGLRERGFGAFEGKTFAEIEKDLPEDSMRWRKRDPLWTPPQGGESLSVMEQRVRQTLDELAAKHVGQHIALFAHGGVMDLLYRIATGQDLQAPRSWTLTNTAVNRLLWTPESVSLVGWADTSHLDEATRDEF